MQNLQDLQEKIFFESKSILETLAKINSKEELLAKQDLFAEITDRIAFLRILEKNKELFTQEVSPQNFEIKEPESVFNKENHQTDEHFEDSPFEDDMIEEEVIFTNEINDIEKENIPQSTELTDISETTEIVPINEPVAEMIPEAESIAEETPVASPQIDEKRLAQKEKEFLEAEERRRKIIEFNKEETAQPVKEEAFQGLKIMEQNIEKKFKLASIKGLKAVQNLFDEDPLEKLKEEEQEKKEKKEEKPDTGSLLKTNISTDFMEAEKKKPDFKIDLNDKVAFTKLLFKGNEDQLKATVDHLNTFDNLEDARQYLSEVYYLNDWRKADEYAQRLWSLVENKFL